jgi:hypothetical protein
MAFLVARAIMVYLVVAPIVMLAFSYINLAFGA